MEKFRITDLLEIPKFDNYVRQPNESTCKIIDSTKLMVEVL
jgi:hypothetical protein